MSKALYFQENIMPKIINFSNTKPIRALKDGVLNIIPLSLIGSVFLLLAQIPSPQINKILISIFGENFTDPLFKVYGATFAIMALVTAFSIAYSYAKNDGYEGLSAGVISLVSFLVVLNDYTVDEAGKQIGNVIPKAWIGGQGMVGAIIIGLISGFLYTWFLKKDIRIKMPEGVPPNVANAFTALVPGFVIILGSMLVYTGFKFGLKTSFMEWIYKVIQAPLQGMTDSLWGAILIAILPPILWWFGVHGTSIMMGVMTGLLTANMLENQTIFASKGSLILSDGANIVTQQLQDNFITLGGTGLTLCLSIAILIAGRSNHAKSLGKLAVIPGLFNINEPVVFGFPIVFNPILIIPFICVPLMASLLTYLAISIGFMHPFTGVVVPWTTPPIISGFLVSGWQGAIVQLIILVLGVLIYLPFMKKQDNIYLQEEKLEEKKEESVLETV